jgi:outer membrane receptor protein involved in Fe transport
MFRKSPLATAVSVALAASTLGISPQLLAQEAEDAEADDDVIDEIVTTGSRIRRDQFSSNSPIDVVLTETAELKGIGDVAEMLQTTTIAAGSAQVTAATSTAFVQGGGIGAQTLSLRGLGANRTLSLLNGRRAGPAGTRGGVSAFDLNVIPLAALERVEILKDGASSIYGSDAIGGVVNYITKKGDGLSVEGYTSQTSESGGEVSRFSASFGKTFSRGRFRVTGDFYRTEELEKQDRDYLACEADNTISPETGWRNDRIDARTGEPWCGDLLWGQVWLYDYNQYYYDANIPLNSIGADQLIQFDYDGDLGNYIPQNPLADVDAPFGVQIPEGWYMVGYDRISDGVTNARHPAMLASSVIPEIERQTFFADAEVDLTDSMTLYGEVLLNRRETQVDSMTQFWSYVYNGDDGCGGCFFDSNPDPQAEGWGGWNWLSPTAGTEHFGSFIRVDYSRYLAGLRGDITDNWSFDINYQYSESDGDYNDDQVYDDSIRSTNFAWFGQIPCVDGKTAIRGATCIDLPWLDPEFLAGNLTPEQREFLYGVDKGNTKYTQSSWEAFVTGELFELPAGGVQTAFGVHYREDEINDVPGEAALNDNTFTRSSAGITTGKDTTQAVFAEFDIPLIADKTAFQELSLNVSARYTDVDSYGSDTTYKASVNWQIVDALRFRANHGTSFRTPALFELYLADETSFPRQSAVDPCIRWGSNLEAGNISQTTANNCAATITNEFPDGIPPDFTGGNISATAISRGGFGLLEAETSESTTLGLVWTPEFADLSVAVDYFDIQVDDQVDQLGSSIVRGCYASEFFPDDPLCSLFDRSLPGSSIDNILDAYINVATQENSGWDLTARYSVDAGPGTLILTTQHTLQDEAKTELFEGFERDFNGELGEPEWVGNFDATYIVGDWVFFWGVDAIGTSSSVERAGGNEGTIRGTPVIFPLTTGVHKYHDFSITKAFDNGLTIIAGVNNAFDKKPPQLTSVNLGVQNVIGTSAFYSQYDLLGQRWFLQLRYEIE